MSKCRACVWPLAAAVLFAASAGCGTRRYEEQLEKTVAQLKQERRSGAAGQTEQTAGTQLPDGQMPAGPGRSGQWQGGPGRSGQGPGGQGPRGQWQGGPRRGGQPPGGQAPAGQTSAGQSQVVQLAGTPVTVQVPPFFDQPLPQNSDPRRLRMPAVELPDLKLTYEGHVTDDAGGRIPFYWYLAATPSNPELQLQQQVQAAFPAAHLQWQPTGRAAASDPTVQWKALRATGANQEFCYFDAQGQQSHPLIPATVVLLVCQQGDVFVIMGWRVPTTIEGSIGSAGMYGLDTWAYGLTEFVSIAQ
jgi:hypothetical protein